MAGVPEKRVYQQKTHIIELNLLYAFFVGETSTFFYFFFITSPNKVADEAPVIFTCTKSPI